MSESTFNVAMASPVMSATDMATVVVRPESPTCAVSMTFGDGTTWQVDAGGIRCIGGDESASRVDVFAINRAFCAAHDRCVTRAWNAHREMVEHAHREDAIDYCERHAHLRDCLAALVAAKSAFAGRLVA